MSRQLTVILACVILVVAVSLWATLFGPAEIPFSDVARMIAEAAGLPITADWPAWQQTVVVDVRLPRTIVGLLVGGGLAVCGAAMQGFFRNPLAEPGVIGVASGAALGGVIALFWGLSGLSVWVLPVLAFAGGLVTTLAVYAIATRRGHVEVGTLLLAGVAFAALNVSLSTFVISTSLGDWQVAAEILRWTMGGLDGRTWDHVKIAAPVTMAGIAAVMLYARDLDLLALGETHAWSAGVDVPRVRRMLIFVTAAVTGASVAVAGPIGFVGLVVPHILRLILGPGHRWLVLASAIGGGAFLVAADIAARSINPPEEIQLGVVTALAGGPFFLFLLIRYRRRMAL